MRVVDNQCITPFVTNLDDVVRTMTEIHLKRASVRKLSGRIATQEPMTPIFICIHIVLVTLRKDPLLSHQSKDGFSMPLLSLNLSRISGMT
jgi:hypothetical protein